MTESATRPRSGAPRTWVPRIVQITAAAAEQPHTAEILRRLEAAGVDDVRLLRSNRLTGLNEGSDREIYARAKATMAVVVAPPSAIKPQPIPPSADWRVDLARGCPAHCQYCYLAGSLQGPPVTRVYANLDDVLAGIGTHVGRGTVTSGTTARGHEGTTFELSAPSGTVTRNSRYCSSLPPYSSNAVRTPFSYRYNPGAMECFPVTSSASV